MTTKDKFSPDGANLNLYADVRLAKIIAGVGEALATHDLKAKVNAMADLRHELIDLERKLERFC